MALVAIIPEKKEELEQGIFALEWQLEQPGLDEKSRYILVETLDKYRHALEKEAKN